MRNRSSLGLVVAAAFLACLVLPAWPASAAEGETLDVWPTPTVVPATVTVTGYCLDTYETYWSLEGGAQQQYLSVNYEPFEFSVPLVDQNGRDLRPGTYTISTECGPSTSVEVLAAPTVRLDPTSGRPGTAVMVSGTCPPEFSGPEIYFDGEHVTTGTLEDGGTFDSATFTVPDVDAGEYDVTTSCDASTTFEVLPGIPASLTLEPTSGVVGDTVTASGACPTSSEDVGVYFGDVFVGSDTVDVDTGRFGPLEFAVPQAEFGPVTVETDCGAEQTFTVTRPTEVPASPPVPAAPTQSGTPPQPNAPPREGAPPQPNAPPLEGVPPQPGGPVVPGSPRSPSTDPAPPTAEPTQGPDGVVRVRVPDLSGLTEDEARAALGDALVLLAPTDADGLVADQVPPAGTLVEPASAVSVLLAPVPEPSRWPLLALALVVGAAVVGLVARERWRRRRVRDDNWLDEQVRTETTPHVAAVSGVPDRAVPGLDVRLEVRRHPSRL